MEVIEASATLRFFRISPQKTRLVANLIRGKRVEDAVKTLSFTRRKGARVLLKLLKSAIANAEVKNVEDTELLEVSEVQINQGPSYRRFMPRARGRADVLRRPTSHIKIVVREDIEAKREAEARRAEHEAKRAKKRAAKKKDGAKKEKETKAAKAEVKEKPKTAKKKAAAKKEPEEKESKEKKTAKKKEKPETKKAAPAKSGESKTAKDKAPASKEKSASKGKK